VIKLIQSFRHVPNPRREEASSASSWVSTVTKRRRAALPSSNTIYIQKL
jgi:hypothetical protein